MVFATSNTSITALAVYNISTVFIRFIHILHLSLLSQLDKNIFSFKSQFLMKYISCNEIYLLSELQLYT